MCGRWCTCAGRDTGLCRPCSVSAFSGEGTGGRESRSQGVRVFLLCGCPMQTTVHALPAEERESAKLGAEPSQRRPRVQ